MSSTSSSLYHRISRTSVQCPPSDNLKVEATGPRSAYVQHHPPWEETNVATSTYTLIFLISGVFITSVFIASCVFGWYIFNAPPMLVAGPQRAARSSVCAAVLFAKAVPTWRLRSWMGLCTVRSRCGCRLRCYLALACRPAGSDRNVPNNDGPLLGRHWLLPYGAVAAMVDSLLVARRQTRHKSDLVLRSQMRCRVFTAFASDGDCCQEKPGIRAPLMVSEASFSAHV
jgi:hypothetical protein